jgi:hypothetical protein
LARTCGERDGEMEMEMDMEMRRWKMEIKRWRNARHPDRRKAGERGGGAPDTQTDKQSDPRAKLRMIH